MFVQKVFKGISCPNYDALLPGSCSGPPCPELRELVKAVFAQGITCYGLAGRGWVYLPSLVADLNEDSLYDHVTNYRGVGAGSLYISLTAGMPEISRWGLYRHPAYTTARRFATRTQGRNTVGRCHGVIFESWVIVLGIPSWKIIGTAEDLRDRLTYRRDNPFAHQGEVTAKLIVPREQVLRATVVNPRGKRVGRKQTNPNALPPEEMSNVRQAV